MASRKIVYASVQKPGYSNTIYTGVETWGQLKREFPEVAAMAQGMSAFIKRNDGNDDGSTYTSDQQSLPNTDFTIYFLLEKNKSGIDEVVAAINEWMQQNREFITVMPIQEEPQAVNDEND